MKILWITNIMIGGLYETLNDKPSKGVWMDALLDDFKKNNDDEVVVVTTGRVKEILNVKTDNIIYYLLPGGYPIEYNHKKRSNLTYWKTIIDIEKPDLIHIWGSEYTHGLAAINVAENIPSIVYIQGILEIIERYYEAGMTRTELRQSITLRDILKRDWIIAQKHKYQKRAKFEKEMISKSLNVISENLWCNVHCRAINEKVVIHHCPLNINPVFSKYQWSYENSEIYSIMCNASGYPLKGLHILIKALSIVKDSFPLVKLKIPGIPMISKNNFISKLRKNGYTKYIENLIKKYKLSDNIVFIGSLSPKKMAEEMCLANIFIVPSALENHSSTLKEAMLVGTPCVSSYVGGIPEYVKQGENGFLYRFEEYEMLAEYICRIFKDKELAINMSHNGRKTIEQYNNPKNIYELIKNIYSKIVVGNK